MREDEARKEGKGMGKAAMVVRMGMGRFFDKFL